MAFLHSFEGTTAVKDTIETIGVPHTEIDVIFVNGRSVDFTHRLQGGERVSVYPTVERFDWVGWHREKLDTVVARVRTG